MAEIILMGWDETNGVPARVKVTEDGKLIINPSGFLENPPTEDEDTKAPTSEWAYDHAADASAHHARYTDAESRASINNIFGSDGRVDKEIYFDENIIRRLFRFELTRSGYDQNKLIIQSETDGTKMYILGYRGDTGNVNTHIRIWWDSAYRDVIHTETFQAALALYLEASPTSGVTDKAPQSAWAYTHANNASAHHAKYTDAEAVASFYERLYSMETGEYTDFDASNISFILLDTSGGDIDLKGMDNGTYGQIIFFIRPGSANTATVYHNSGDAAAGDKIYTQTGADITLPGYALFYMIYYGGVWIVSNVG